MKKFKLLILIALFPALLIAQGAEIVPFAGYMFGGSVKYIEGKLNLNNGLNYGVSILVPVQSLVDVEINYTKMDKVKASFDPYAGYPNFSYDEFYVSSHYFQIGGISKFYNGSGSVAQPFGSFSLGATWFDTSPTSDSKLTNYDDVWKFSATLGLGVKIMVSDRIGIMLRGRLMMPMTFGGTSFYIGSGGSGVSLNSWVAPLQGDFNGGLIIKLGGN